MNFGQVQPIKEVKPICQQLGNLSLHGLSVAQACLSEYVKCGNIIKLSPPAPTSEILLDPPVDNIRIKDESDYSNTQYNSNKCRRCPGIATITDQWFLRIRFLKSFPYMRLCKTGDPWGGAILTPGV